MRIHNFDINTLNHITSINVMLKLIPSLTPTGNPLDVLTRGCEPE